MAINLFALFPLKSGSPSAPWPYGEPQDITNPGDGTGTPWEVSIGKDIMGLQQALLKRTAIVPTGTPETADVSQYLQAMDQLFSSSLATTVLVLASTAAVAGWRTFGHTAATDGGGGLWAGTGTTTPGKAGTAEYALGFIYDADGRQFEIVPGEINPRQFGAKGDGVTDDAVAVQAAFTLQAARGGGVVRFTPGTYLIDSQLTVGDRVSLLGTDASNTTISFAGATGSFPDSVCIRGEGSAAALPDLTTDIAPGDQEYEFVGVHSLSVDDLIIVNDPRANSYADVDTLFEAGEFIVVARELSVTQIIAQTPAFATTNPGVNTTVDTYDAAEVDMLVVTPIRVALRDLTIIGISDVSVLPVIDLDYARSCTFERIRVSGSQNALIQIVHGYDLTFSNVDMRNSSLGGTDNNGIRLGSCQLVYLNEVRGGGSFSMLSAGLVTAVVSIPTRLVFISNCYAPQQGDAEGAIRFQTNTEYVAIANSTMAGLLIGGDHYRVVGCEIEGQPAAAPGPFNVGWAVAMSGMTGFDVQISACRIAARANVHTNIGLIQWDEATSVLYRPATLVISDTTIDMAGFTGRPMRLFAVDLAVQSSVQLRGVHMTGSGVEADRVQIQIDPSCGWTRLDFHNCRFELLEFRIEGAEHANFVGCEVLDSPGNGIFVAPADAAPFSVRHLEFRSCQILRSWDAGVVVFDTDVEVIVVGTTSLNNNVDPVQSSDKSSFVFTPGAGTTSLVLHGNLFGDDQAVPTQSFAYKYNGVDDVVDSRTTVLGNLAVSRSASVGETLGMVWEEVADEMFCTGTLGLKNADPGAAPSGAADLAIGTGTGSRGIYIKSSTSGDSTLAMGDTGLATQFELVGEHNASPKVLRASVAGANVTAIESTGVHPYVADTKSIGREVKRWDQIYGGKLHGTRLLLDYGAVVAPGDVTLNSGWGTSPSVTAATTGRDSACKIVILTGTGSPGGDPTFDYVYTSGAEGAVIPMAYAQNGPSSNDADWDVQSISSTTVGIRFRGTPTVSATYSLMLFLVWPDHA